MFPDVSFTFRNAITVGKRPKEERVDVAISLQRRAIAVIACPFIDSEARTRLEFVTDDSPSSSIIAEEQHLQMTCFAVNNLFVSGK